MPTTGILSNIGVAMWLLCIVVATVVAVLNRRSPADLPGTADELRRRRERDQYRALALRDPNLARSMAIGRPDLSRTYSDGGLLDVNALSANALVDSRSRRSPGSASPPSSSESSASPLAIALAEADRSGRGMAP